VVRGVQRRPFVTPAVHLDHSDDAAFDERLPLGLQAKSSTHFTPVAVARLAASLLAPEPGMSVLDVGAGAGKFCITAALAMPNARFHGVEWRPHLVRFATRLASEWAVSNVRFVHGDAFDLDWSVYDAFYFYNPFAEQFLDPVFLLDDTIAFDPDNFSRLVMAVRQRLARARLGTRVATYHGFGAPPPLGYELAEFEEIGSDRVELWIKTRAITDDEVEDCAV
jgi:SAM-dependent methyltransferase